MKHVLGIDVGTTAVKAVPLGEDGSLGEVASSQYPLNAPSPGRFEQGPEELFSALRRAVEAAGGRDVRGIGLSTQAAALLLLDRDGRPAGPIISWMDGRAKPEAEGLSRRLGGEFFKKRTGLDGPGIAVPLLAWLKKNDWTNGDTKKTFSCPRSRSPRVSFVEDWLARRLTGRGGSEPTNASITGLLNLEKLDWDADLLSEIGLSTEALPPMRRAGELLGGLLPEPAQRLGLQPGVPVAVAAHDQYAAALGAGVVEPGQGMLSTGTAWVILVLSERVDRAGSRGLFLAPHITGGSWGALAAMPAGNGYFDRALDMLGLEDYAAAESESREVAPGAGGLLFLPCLGERREAAWVGFRLDSRRGDLLRAVMEGLAMEAALRVGEIERTAGGAGEIAMLGGASKSRLWVEIAASVLGRPVAVPATRDAAAVGAAVLGGLAAGWWKDPREGRRHVKLSVQRVEPAPGPYREILERWKDLRAKLSREA